MPFNVDGARQAGASDDQIFDYLTQQMNYNGAGALQAGASKRQIIDHLAPQFGKSDIDQAPYMGTDQPHPFSGPKEPPGAMARFGHGLYESTIGGISNLVTQPKESIRAMTGQNDIEEARQATKEGNWAKAGWHLARYHWPALRIAADTVSAPASDVQQGNLAGAAGQIAGTAAMMLGPEAVSRGLTAAAPKMAETAMHVNKVNRLTKSNPGRALIEETSAITPSAIAEDLGNKSGQLAQQEAQMAAQAAQSGSTGSLQPAIDPIEERQNRAAGAGATKTVRHLNPMRRYFEGPAPPNFTGSTVPGPGGVPYIDPVQPADQLLKMRREFNPNFDIQYGPNASKVSQKVGRQSYAGQTSEVKKAVPGISELDDRLHDIIPAQKAAESTSRNAGILQQSAGRIAAKTGVLAGGAAAGYHLGGIPGAVAGVVLPEVMSSPTVQMAAARSMDLAGKSRALPAAGGSVAGLSQQVKDTTFVQTKEGTVEAVPRNQKDQFLKSHPGSKELSQYAKGGTIHKPHFLVDAKTGKADGIMAEKGPERIVPIKEPGEVGKVEKEVQSGQDVIRGTSDIPLSKHGLKQADELGGRFKAAGFGR